MSTVNFGKRRRLPFVALGTLKDWQPQGVPAVFAITYKRDFETRPKAHTVIYFGEADSLSRQAATINKDVGAWWQEYGQTGQELFVFMHEMPGSSQYERANVQRQLINEYDPQANN
jgi:hypothetical protein